MSEQGDGQRRSNYITPEGFRKLQGEVEFLWKEERPRVTRQVADAAALGDRSENAEYIYGKRRLREIDRRLHYLTRRIDELTVISSAPADPERVFFGAWVRLEDEEGDTVEYRLVGADEVSVESGTISIDSPVGRALLRKREGDEVRVRLPAGTTTYTILRIRYGSGESPQGGTPCRNEP
jgi:transcription elongation factor GreB